MAEGVAEVVHLVLVAGAATSAAGELVLALAKDIIAFFGLAFLKILLLLCAKGMAAG